MQIVEATSREKIVMEVLRVFPDANASEVFDAVADRDGDLYYSFTAIIDHGEYFEAPAVTFEVICPEGQYSCISYGTVETTQDQYVDMSLSEVADMVLLAHGGDYGKMVFSG